MALSPKLQLPAVARLASKANLMLACLGPGICAQGSPHYVFNLHHLNLYGQINHTWYANSFAFKMKQGKDMFSEIKLTAAKIFFLTSTNSVVPTAVILKNCPAKAHVRTVLFLPNLHMIPYPMFPGYECSHTAPCQQEETMYRC